MSARRVRTSVAAFLASIVLGLSADPARCQDDVSPGDAVRIELRDGEFIVGTVAEVDADSISVVTASGVRAVIPRSAIARLRIISAADHERGLYREDPNYSRLMFSPTGRPLRRGDGYFSDHYVLLPGVGVGVTDNFSLYAGLSLVPGVGIDEQMFYIAPRLGLQINEGLAASVGTIFVTVSDFRGGLAFGAVTLGGINASVTGAYAIGYTKEEGEDFEFADDHIIMLGGAVRLSNSAALVTENWLFLGGAGADEQPFALALRFFGDRIAVDVGFVVIAAVIEEGFPIPWLSMAYNWRGE